MSDIQIQDSMFCHWKQSVENTVLT